MKFDIIEHPGRLQPFTLWRGSHVWYFAASRAEAEAYTVMQQRVQRRAA